ncbi:12972_t:CDS:2 [Funneliformis geosporum]|uniref:GTP-binding protein n=1 Tax=Funneliformis geosporum TaxID=1117311 RepID=A0A9W4WUF2_9GLOM|nr:11989_t:CDS:2 [Funneliformis geosporum]CAI2164526.1 12972_t:CDS:2 [Funneliformis geosporum]
MSHFDVDEYSLHTSPVVGNEEDPVQDHRPRLLIMGLRRSGKSSIQKVVFHKMPPNETLFLESTNKVIKENITSFIDFQVWDFPGQIDYFDPAFDSNVIFGEYGALIFVIDAQDDYIEALSRLHQTVTRAFQVNPDLTFEVFIHKVDALSDEYKIDTQRDIQQRTTDDLVDVGLENVPLSFYLTSIYDHSIFEAFSKVIQKLVPQLPTLENLLNILCSNSGIEKAFLFDVNSKIYIATDSSPVDMQTYEICSDMIDVIIDISEIYGRKNSFHYIDEIYGDDQTQVETNGNAGNYGTTTDTANDASSLIKLNNGMVLCLRGVNRFLALVCLLRSDNFEKHGLINYNFGCFKQAIAEVFELKRHSASERLRRERMRLSENEDNVGG